MVRAQHKFTFGFFLSHCSSLTCKLDKYYEMFIKMMTIIKKMNNFIYYLGIDLLIDLCGRSCLPGMPPMV